MSSPFESAFATAAVPALLGVHGQALVYQPEGAQPRTIVAGVSEQSHIIDGPKGGLIRQEWLIVFCKRDPVTGIDDPQLGDELRRQSDPPERIFAFHGERENTLSPTWTLRFLRERPYQVGGNSL